MKFAKAILLALLTMYVVMAGIVFVASTSFEDNIGKVRHTIVSPIGTTHSVYWGCN